MFGLGRLIGEVVALPIRVVNAPIRIVNAVTGDDEPTVLEEAAEDIADAFSELDE